MPTHPNGIGMYGHATCRVANETTPPTVTMMTTTTKGLQEGACFAAGVNAIAVKTREAQEAFFYLSTLEEATGRGHISL